MAKAPPSSRWTVRAISVAALLLLHALSMLADVSTSRRASGHYGSAIAASGETCRAASGEDSHAPAGGRRDCALCPLGLCEGDAAQQAAAFLAHATLALYPPPDAAPQRPWRDAPAAAPAGHDGPGSPRAPPRA
jgi:hypothetical protein